jgi:hypothetical protein
VVVKKLNLAGDFVARPCGDLAAGVSRWPVDVAARGILAGGGVGTWACGEKLAGVAITAAGRGAR